MALIGILVVLGTNLRSDLHEVSIFIGIELIMRPERIVKSKITMLFNIIGVEKASHVTDHIHA